MARSLGRRRGLAVLIVLVLSAAAPTGASGSGARSADGQLSVIENGKIRVGVNLADGGKITYLAAVSGPLAHNLVQGVGIEQSYYGGPPDQYWQENADNATVIANRNDGHTIYTKVIAQQPWPAYKQCECTFETWITLNGNTVHVRNRLTNFRTDGTSWTAHFQELPAFYTSGDAYRLYTYDGDAPYTGASIREITEDRGGFFSPGVAFRAAEHWAALVNDAGYGVGLFKPDLVGFSGIPGNEYAVDYGWVNGYMTSSTEEILDASGTFSYDYTIVVGGLDDIRAYAVAHRPDPRPVYRFRTNRQNWWELNAIDTGAPIRGALRVLPDRYDPQLYGPMTWFRAKSVRNLYVRGAWDTRQNSAQLFWSSDAGGFSEQRSVRFFISNDGRFHTYRLPIAGSGQWSGMVTQLRFDPVAGAEPGHVVDISCISWKPCPREPAQERRLSRSAPPAVFADSFDSTNQDFWSKDESPGTSAETSAGRLLLKMDPGTEGSAGTGSIAAGLTSRCALAGNYDVRVGYQLLEWPTASGVHLNLAAGAAFVGRLNTSGDAYFAYFAPRGFDVPTTDERGSLRLVRRNGAVTAYYERQGRWVSIVTDQFAPGAAALRLSLSSDQTEFGGSEVSVALDDLRVVRGRIDCP